MKRLIIFLPRFIIPLLLSWSLILGINSNFLPIKPVYAETISSNNSPVTETIPYWIWLVLPRIFPEYLDDKGGYLSLGFSWQSGKETPVGITKSAVGDGQVSLNCNACHQSNPNHGEFLITPTFQFKHQRYQQFLVSCAQDPRFRADYILPYIEYNHQLSWLQKQRYRWLLIPQVKRQLLAFENKDN